MKAWKARAQGYRECLKTFSPALDEKDLSKYMGVLKKFVTDSNELNRALGLEASIKYLNSGGNISGK